MPSWLHWTPMEALQLTVFMGFLFLWHALRDVEKRLFEMHKVLDRIADNTGRAVPSHMLDYN